MSEELVEHGRLLRGLAVPDFPLVCLQGRRHGSIEKSASPTERAGNRTAAEAAVILPKLKTAVLGWDADGGRVELPVELHDISIQGCRVKSRVCPAPKPGELIWFQAPDVHPQAWIEGVLVSTIKPFLRKSSSRIRFLRNLPYQTFKMLVYGPEGIDLELSSVPSTRPITSGAEMRIKEGCRAKGEQAPVPAGRRGIRRERGGS